MFYALFVTVVVSGVVTETQWKTYDRFEECWEAATAVTHNQPNITARCVMVDKKDR